MSLGASISGLSLPNASNYIIESATEGDKELDMEDVFDENGALVTRIIHNAFARVEATLLCKTAASPTGDFPTGTLIANTWFVNSAPVTKTKSPHRVQLSVTNIGIS